MSILDQEQDRFFLWVPVALGLGISVYFLLLNEPSWTVALLTLGVSGGVLFFFKKRPVFFKLAIFFVFISIGFALAKGRTWSVDTVMLREKIENQVFSGILIDLEEKPTCYRLLFDSVVVSESASFPNRVRLTFPKSKILPEIGDHIEGIADFLPFSAPVGLNSYDFRRQAYFQKIGASGRLKNIIKIKKQPSNSWWEGQLKQRRHQLTTILKQKIPGAEGEIAAALVTGERSAIPDSIRQDFTDAGLAHLLAISGLHLGLVAGLIFAVLRRGLAFFPFIAEAFPVKKWAAVFVIPTMGLYLLISGIGIPAQRSFIMITIVMLSILLDRQAISMRLVAWAAILVLMFTPESLLSAGFQLSFSAVVALIAAYESGWSPLKKWEMEGKKWRKLIVYSVSVIATTIIATAATTPFTIYSFNRFTLQAILGNLIAVPLTAVAIIPLLLLSLASLTMGGFSVLFEGVWFSLHFLTQMAHFVAKLPGAVMTLPTPPLSFLCLTTLGGLWICLWQKYWRWYGILVVFLGISTLFLPQDHPDILIAEGGQVMAYRRDKTLYVSSLSSGRFYTDFWQRELGLHRLEIWQDPIMVFKKNGHEILLISQVYKRYSQVRNLCQQNSLILSNQYVKNICPKVLTDKKDLTTTVLFWVTSQGIKEQSTEPRIRPWTFRL